MKGFIRLNTEDGVLLVNVSKIRTVNPANSGAEVYLDGHISADNYAGKVYREIDGSYQFKFSTGFLTRRLLVSETFEEVCSLIERAQ